MIRSSLSVYQTSYNLLCGLLRAVLVDGVRAGRGAVGGIGSVRCRVSATLYALLLAHPLDRDGRCRSCRGRGAVFGRRRRCRVHIEASYWLRQPEEFLHSRVVEELGLVDQSESGAGAGSERDSGTRLADPDATDMLPRIEPDVGDLPTQPLQAPAVSPTPRFPAGRPDRDHGGAGEHTWPRRVPPEDPPPPPSGWSLLLAGGIT